MIHRRRLLSIMAASLAAPALPALGSGLKQWRGVALGADASITLAHPDADTIIARALAEVSRLEAIFSLHRPHSALARLNAQGHLEAPPFELLECLGICARIHAATGGAFDPTIQPLWALYAEHYARTDQTAPPSAAAREAALAKTGWHRLRIAVDAIRMEQGMALTLNGIAQGYIADRIAALLRGVGLDRVLVNTGEFHAIGGDPRGGSWDIGLQAGTEILPERVALADAALASSAAGGITFDRAGAAGHILDPKTAAPARSRWRLVTVTAPRAVIADGLSTAFCLMTRTDIERTLVAMPNVEARLFA